MAKALVLGLTLLFYVIAFGLAVGAIEKRSRVRHSFHRPFLRILQTSLHPCFEHFFHVCSAELISPVKYLAEHHWWMTRFVQYVLSCDEH
jgi:hypothetical protein